ncbi:DUF1752-domain-containing protein [Cadophora sp. DSE1049]|nr:DUF1752-domain-containing protein [Cadophora sp. DSE1049]
MPSRLNAPALTVDVRLKHEFDTRNVENLFRLWTGEPNATTPAISISARSSGGLYSAEPPSLSGSLDSLVNEEALEFDPDNTPTSVSVPADTSYPHIQRQDSLHPHSRGRERDVTSDDLEMIINIKEKKDLADSSKSINSGNPSDHSARPAPSDSAHCNGTGTIVVHGFWHYASLYPSITLLTGPSSIPMADIAAANSTNGRMFAVGASSGEDLSSEQTDLIQPTTPQLKKQEARFSFGGLSGEDGNSLPQTHNALADSAQQPLKKQTSFKEDPITAQIVKEEQVFDDDVFESDEDEIDESAIDDDDDSSDWEDSIEDSGNASIDEKTFFQRVDPRPNLTSRRSLITTMLHQNDRANALASAAAASRSTPALHRSCTSSPNGPSLAASPDSDDVAPLMIKKGLKPISEIPQSAAQPIIQTTTNTTPHQLALSPRTTRRNMLASELTVSLRQHLLWERKQKLQITTAVSNRRHTAHDVAHLKQVPGQVCMDKDDGDKPSWNDYYGQGLGEYHSRGW